MLLFNHMELLSVHLIQADPDVNNGEFSSVDYFAANGGLGAYDQAIIPNC